MTSPLLRSLSLSNFLHQIHLVKSVSLLILALFSFSFATAQTTVSSDSQFNNLTLSPGDVVTWENGTYSNQEIIFIAGGTANNPITLKAETPGGVIFTGETQINIAGDYLILEGFYWDGGIGTSDHVEFRKSGSNNQFGNNCTIRNCAFNNLSTSGDDKSRWIVMYGSNNTVENCSFINKLSTGACILVELRYQNGGVAGHQIRNNYFYNFPSKDGRVNDNDSEVIRIGVSSFQTVNAGVTVQGNYFKEVDGENEIISNKSVGNIYRHNTFRKSRGSLVLRHGAGATVDGNYFLGENKAKSGGIRISDSDHIIINNYMQGLSNAGDIFNNGITLMGGGTSSGGTSSGYQNVENILVAFNTIYNSDDPIHYNDSKGSFKPQGELANNLVYSTNGTIVSGDISQIGSNISYTGNLFGGSALGISTSGVTDANPNFSIVGELYKPSNSGAAANSAVGSYAQVSTDIEGTSRPSSNKDVGAHEVSGGSGSSTNPAPITDTQVGVDVGACFLNSSGISFNCSSTPPPPSDFLTVSSLSEFSATGGSSSLSISSNISWNVSDNQSWISVSPTSGSNDGSTLVTVSENSGSNARTGTITLTGGNISRTVSVVQAASSIPGPSYDAPYDIPRFQAFIAECKLQAPTSSTAATQSSLINGYSSSSFYVVNGDEVAFNQSGASRRTELRYLDNWTVSQNDRFLHANLKIAEQTNNQVTVLQIHDDANAGPGPNKPLLRIYKHKAKTPADHLWAAYKTDASGTATSHIDLGLAPAEYFDCDINIVGGRLIVKVDGVEKANVDISFWSFPSYWKAGVYLQDLGEATAYFNELTEGILPPQPPTTYTLTTSSTGNGAISLDPAGGEYAEGTLVTLTANPDANYQFDGWSGAATGNSTTTTVTMNSDLSASASFSPAPVNPCNGESVIMDEGFNNDLGTFSYVSGIFTAPNSTYESSTLNASNVSVQVGGVNNNGINNLSLGLTSTFEKLAEGETTFTIDYQLNIAPQYESNEYAEVRVEVDGTLLNYNGNSYLYRIDGNDPSSSGAQQATLTLPNLSLGQHTIEIGVFNNRKTWNDEVSTLLLDNVRISEECPVNDADGDGVTDELDQCPGLDDALIGTSCNDNDPCTTNDVYDASCGCSGTPVGDADNDGVCDALDACPSFDDALIGTSCDDGDPCTINDLYGADCSCAGTVVDTDTDGVCDALDQCPGTDDALIGTACDDNDPCTINDVYGTDCSCAGVVLDTDNDGVCDAEDQCPGTNDALIGTACDDNDPSTINDVYGPNCTCAGTPEFSYIAPYDIPRFQAFIAECKLQAPTSTTAATQSALINGYFSSSFYVVNGDEVAFNQSGASRRTELRYLDNWTISQNDRFLHANLKIAEQTNNQVTVMQIHDDANAGSGPNKPLLRIYKHKAKTPADHLWAAFKTDASGTATTHIDLGLAPTEYFDCDINIVGGRLIVKVDGVEKANMDASFWNFPSYWKAGVYLQDAGEATVYFNELTEGILIPEPPTTYGLSTATTGNGSVILNPAGGIYEEGTVVTLTANPDANNQFDGWSGAASGTEATTTLVVNSELSVTASFSPSPVDPCDGESVILDEGFNNNLGSFSYVSGIFTSPKATYESASLNSSNVALQVGGVNNNNINNLSLGLISTFEKSLEGVTTINVDYQLTIARQYEPNEYAEVRIEIDGNLLNYNGNSYLYRIDGNDPTSSGTQQVTLSIPNLSLGEHTIEIGVFNNRKTWNDEVSTLLLDNVRIAEECPQINAAENAAESNEFAFMKQNSEQTRIDHKVYPNPFKNNITIDLNPDLNYIKVSVLNSQGRLIQEVSSPDQFLDDQLRLQINEGAGTYILVIESKEGVDVKRALQLDN